MADGVSYRVARVVGFRVNFGTGLSGETLRQGVSAAELRPNNRAPVRLASHFLLAGRT